jgi:excisionase family DNA binding protein
MAEKLYNMNRELAAKHLGISTRTIDRYIKSGKLSYKKIANKVLMNKQELDELLKEFEMLRSEASSELIGNHERDEEKEIFGEPATGSSVALKSSLEDAIDQKIDKLFTIFQEKDKMLEDKNKIIMMLQQRV